MQTLARQVSRKVADPAAAVSENDEGAHNKKEEEEEEPAPIIPVIIHNPRCSKSRAFLTMLDQEGIQVHVRDYESNPLSLSEIETIDARLSSTTSENLVSICRDLENIVQHEDHDAHEVMLATLALNPLERLERPIVVFGEEAKIGRPDPNDLIAWLREKAV